MVRSLSHSACMKSIQRTMAIYYENLRVSNLAYMLGLTLANLHNLTSDVFNIAIMILP